MMHRRTFLMATAALPLAGCTADQIAKAQQDWSNFVDKVNALLSQGCGVIPGFIATANSIAAVVGAYFPTIQAAIMAGGAAVQAVASAICSMVPAASPQVLAAKLRAATPSVPIVVGNVAINGKVIPIHGYGVRFSRHHR